MEVNKILQGDALEKLKELPNDSIDCVITSPPYWNLRDYKVAGQLGLEPTFTEYINKLLAIFDEIKRVLKPTGTVWVNLGDTFSGSKDRKQNSQIAEHSKNKDYGTWHQNVVKERDESIRPKSLLAIPDRFKIAMIDRGWICRNEIIWHKRNAMPSSAKDRFTIDYEKIFFFTKSERYFFETQYEPYSEITMKEFGKAVTYDGVALKDYQASGVQVAGDVKRRTAQSIAKNMPKFGGNKAEGYGNPTYSGDEWKPATFGRLKRCVWDITTKGFAGDHFAIFPEDLLETPIRAGCPERICTNCGKIIKTRLYKERRVNTRPGDDVGNGKSGTTDDPNSELPKSDLSKHRQQIIREPISMEEALEQQDAENYERELKQWGPCECKAPFIGGIVLDPFFGAGTTGLVALKNGRKFLGIELNPEYIAIALKRLGPHLNQTTL